jgi:hypothetical protein
MAKQEILAPGEGDSLAGEVASTPALAEQTRESDDQAIRVSVVHLPRQKAVRSQLDSAAWRQPHLAPKTGSEIYGRLK